MGNFLDNGRSEEIRTVKLNIIELETNLERINETLKKKKNNNNELKIQQVFLQRLLRKQKEALHKLELLNVTESTANSMFYDEQMKNDFDDALNTIMEKTNDVSLSDDEKSNPDNDDANTGNASVLISSDILHTPSDNTNITLETQLPEPPDHTYIDLETRLMRLNSVESRLQELDDLIEA